MKRSWIVLVVVLCLASSLALVLAACGGGSIVGVWTDKAGMEFEFAADGGLSIRLAGQVAKTTYSVSDGKLRIEGADAAELPPEFDYKVDGDELILTSPDGEEEILYRK